MLEGQPLEHLHTHTNLTQYWKT